MASAIVPKRCMPIHVESALAGDRSIAHFETACGWATQRPLNMHLQVFWRAVLGYETRQAPWLSSWIMVLAIGFDAVIEDRQARSNSLLRG